MVKRLAICVCSLVLLATVVSAQEKMNELPPLPKGVVNVGDPSKIKAVLAREDDFRDAYMKLDAKLVADLYSDDFLIVKMGGPGCCVSNKEAQVQELIKHRDAKPPFPISSMTNDQVVVRVHGNSAIVSGVQTIVASFPTETPVRTVTVRFLFMDVWALEHGKWLIIGRTNKIL